MPASEKSTPAQGQGESAKGKGKSTGEKGTSVAGKVRKSNSTTSWAGCLGWKWKGSRQVPWGSLGPYPKPDDVVRWTLCIDFRATNFQARASLTAAKGQLASVAKRDENFKMLAWTEFYVSSDEEHKREPFDEPPPHDQEQTSRYWDRAGSALAADAKVQLRQQVARTMKLVGQSAGGRVAKHDQAKRLMIEQHEHSSSSGSAAATQASTERAVAAAFERGLQQGIQQGIEQERIRQAARRASAAPDASTKEQRSEKSIQAQADAEDDVSSSEQGSDDSDEESDASSEAASEAGGVASDDEESDKASGEESSEDSDEESGASNDIKPQPYVALDSPGIAAGAELDSASADQQDEIVEDAAKSNGASGSKGIKQEQEEEAPAAASSSSRNELVVQQKKRARAPSDSEREDDSDVDDEIGQLKKEMAKMKAEMKAEMKALLQAHNKRKKRKRNSTPSSSSSDSESESSSSSSDDGSDEDSDSDGPLRPRQKKRSNDSQHAEPSSHRSRKSGSSSGAPVTPSVDKSLRWSDEELEILRKACKKIKDPSRWSACLTVLQQKLHKRDIRRTTQSISTKVRQMGYLQRPV